MEYITYQHQNFSCHLPDYCKVKSDFPTLTVVSKNQKKKETYLSVDFDSGFYKSIKTSVSFLRIVDDENRRQKELRRGKYCGKWKGKELLWELFWYHNEKFEYGWWLALDVNGSKVGIQLAFDGDFLEGEKTWSKVFDSFEIETIKT